MKRLIPLLCLAAVLCFAQAPSKPAPPPAADDVQALSNDLARMRSLVHQMEMNLAFVQTTQTPLKHQFELEIDMWRTVIGQMERHLQSLRAQESSRSPK
ncbi:MAG: hypothetical protein ACR2IF_09195 [Terriglobales bacterium]